MKTLKILTALCIVTVFFAGNADAQKQKQTGTISYQMQMYFCSDEMITFEVTGTWTSWADKYQWRFKGVGTGETSGAIYRFSEVDNYKWKTWIDGQANNNTTVWTLAVSKEGEPVGVMHFTGHSTMNANGVLTAEVDNFILECF